MLARLALAYWSTGHGAEALALARQLRDPGAIAVELRNLGVMLGQNGQLERGRPMIEESLLI